MKPTPRLGSLYASALRVTVLMAVTVATLLLTGSANPAPLGASHATGLANMVNADFGPAIGAGSWHTCAIKQDGSLYCWGNNGNFQSQPPSGTFLAVSAASYHTCALRTDGAIVCWGDNSWGESNPPSGSFMGVATSGSVSCGLKTDGTIVCWGTSSWGETNPPSGTYTAIDGEALGFCALDSSGVATCWGWDSGGFIVPPSEPFVALSAGNVVDCGLTPAGTIRCWGRDFYNQLSTPPGSFTAVTNGWYHTCGLLSDGSLACWGASSIVDVNAPAGAFQAVGAGIFHTCGVKTDGSVLCWGDNSYGQLDVEAGFGPANAPPVLNVPTDFAIDATSPDGTVVFYDASATDDSGLTPTVNCTPPSGSVFAIGDTTVECMATDADGATASATFTVHVTDAAEQLADLADAVDGVGPGTSLADKIEAAQAAYTAGDTPRTCEILNAFINQVEAQPERIIASGTASTLIADATRIRAVLGC